MDVESYSKRIDDNRKVYLDGEIVKNVATEPAFLGAVNVINSYYRLQVEKPETHTTLDRSGNAIAASLSIPESVTDLQSKRRHYKEIADLSFGMLGRTPDFMNAAIMSWAVHSEFLGDSSATSYSQNMKDYYRLCCERNLFVAHGAINPKIDRNASLGSSEHPFCGVKVIHTNEEGIVVSGAKMIVTLAPIADEIMVFNMPGLKPGDEDFALAFALPIASPGLQLVCRKPLSRGGEASFDYPLANLFDEIDSYMILTNVFVPWERVFVFKDVMRSNQFYDRSFARNHAGHQGAARAISKGEFVAGVASKIAQDLELSLSPNVQEQLGEIASDLEAAKALVERSENQSQADDSGTFNPDIAAIHALRINFPRMYSRALEKIRSLAPGSMMALPTEADFKGSNGNLLREALGSTNLNAMDRVKLLNLAWDLVGEGFGQRQLTYEIYHAGDPTIIARSQFRGYDWEKPRQSVSLSLSNIDD